MFEHMGTKAANELKCGDFVTLTGHIDEVAEIEDIYFDGRHVEIRTNDGAGKIVAPSEQFKVYT